MVKDLPRLTRGGQRKEVAFIHTIGRCRSTSHLNRDDGFEGGGVGERGTRGDRVKGERQRVGRGIGFVNAWACPRQESTRGISR